MFCSMIKYFAAVLVLIVLIDGAPTGRFNLNEDDTLDQILQEQTEIEKNSVQINSEEENENPNYDANNSNVSENERQMEFMRKYHDYELDTTDTDQFNEEDQLLRAYYGRRSLFDDYADAKSFADVMRADAGSSRRDTTLHYGGYMSDESAAEESAKEANEDYEIYDYDY